MIKVFIIRNRDTDSNVAVLLHDMGTGRVLFRSRAGDSSLMKTFNIMIDRPIIIQTMDNINGASVSRRYKVLPTDMDYGTHLIDKFVFRPYEVKYVYTLDSDIIDHELDLIYTKEIKL